MEWLYQGMQKRRLFFARIFDMTLHIIISGDTNDHRGIQEGTDWGRRWEEEERGEKETEEGSTDWSSFFYSMTLKTSRPQRAWSFKTFTIGNTPSLSIVLSSKKITPSRPVQRNVQTNFQSGGGPARFILLDVGKSTVVVIPGENWTPWKIEGGWGLSLHILCWSAERKKCLIFHF